jgi:putative transposase
MAIAPLDSCCPVGLIDAIVVKVRGGQVRNRPVWGARGISTGGERDVRGAVDWPHGRRGRHAVG